MPHTNTTTKSNPTTKSHDEYIIYSTTYENLLQILKNGYISNKPKENLGFYMLNQLVYYNITNQANMWAHFLTCIVLDKKILKDYPFIATPRYESDVLVRGKGKLDKIPRLTKLKTHISKYMTLKRTKQAKFMDIHTKFIESHEILFNKKIPLDKYCIKIMLPKNETNKDRKELVKSIVIKAEERNIPLKFRDYKLKGKNEKPINNFINSIEKN